MVVCVLCLAVVVGREDGTAGVPSIFFDLNGLVEHAGASLDEFTPLDDEGPVLPEERAGLAVPTWRVRMVLGGSGERLATFLRGLPELDPIVWADPIAPLGKVGGTLRLRVELHIAPCWLTHPGEYARYTDDDRPHAPEDIARARGTVLADLARPAWEAAERLAGAYEGSERP